MAYYTLCTKEDGKLHPQFGDYSRSVVVQEKADSYRGQSTVIVRSATAHQHEVNAAIAAMQLTLEELAANNTGQDIVTLTDEHRQKIVIVKKGKKFGWHFLSDAEADPDYEFASRAAAIREAQNFCDCGAVE